MLLADYFREVRGIRRPLASAVIAIMNPLARLDRRPADNASVLRSLWPIVETAHTEAGTLARRFYDEERAERLGTSERHDFYRSVIKPEWFAEALTPVLVATAEPARDGAEQARQTELVTTAAIAVVDSGGRGTMLRATETDRELAGWARVEGGAESCAFCTMLISRGPVYSSADAAGLDADDESAKELAEAYERTGDRSELDSLMKRFHVRCDCQVVPVFDRADWPGIDQYRAAEAAWIEASKAAKEAGTDPLNALRYQLDGKAVPSKKEKT